MSRSQDGARGGPSADRIPLSAYYHAARIRTDHWNRLRDNSRRLASPIDGEEPGADPALVETVATSFRTLGPIEPYFAFPGRQIFERLERHFREGVYAALAAHTARVVRLLVTGWYRRLDVGTMQMRGYVDLVDVSQLVSSLHARIQEEGRPYFEVLVVDEVTPEQEAFLRSGLLRMRSDQDEFIYEVVVVQSFEDALIALLLNPNLQSCVVRYSFPFRSRNRLEILDEHVTFLGDHLDRASGVLGSERSVHLGRLARRLRPEVDLFLVTDAPVEEVAGPESRAYSRIFTRSDDFQELHLSILKGIRRRYETPFFRALQRYAQKPTGVFHALPISRGKSILGSNWIQDLGKFFGANGFLAETSATTGGLDSLLQPHGPLKEAQERAARAFGARRTFFVTNGTSTANKIVMQSLVRPGDIVLLAHDCHKSHPYAVIMAGALPVYMDAYPLSELSMYGGVTLREIKRHLLELRRAGKLDRVRMLLLTNITFDGITYDPVRIMEEVLAIKPDMIFVWDEAWFAYGRFHPTLRRRTAMEAATRLRGRLGSAAYRGDYRAWRAPLDSRDPADDAAWLETRLLPDPERARVRVYATQSTHKTLTALRQGSMIHVHDEDFERVAEDAFLEAYMTHTSTSPNYPILVSLDVGRRQVELEGYELVQRSVELAMMLRERITSDELLGRYFEVLGPEDMIPEGFRPSGLRRYFDPAEGWSRMAGAWEADEFALDPTRVTIHVGRTGMDGDTFKNLLMDRYDIQINKTSRNTVLVMIHIGATRGTVSHLVKVLTEIAEELDDRLAHQSSVERRLHEARVRSLTRELPPLPNFSRFHRVFRPAPDSATPEGDMRRAFFLAYDREVCEYLKLGDEARDALASGREVVSASFVTPYPPGFPVLVPGQVVSREILDYLNALDVKEIHGYRAERGLRVFSEEALRRQERGEVREAAARELAEVEGD